LKTPASWSICSAGVLGGDQLLRQAVEHHVAQLRVFLTVPLEQFDRGLYLAPLLMPARRVAVPIADIFRLDLVLLGKLVIMQGLVHPAPFEEEVADVKEVYMGILPLGAILDRQPRGDVAQVSLDRLIVPLLRLELLRQTALAGRGCAEASAHRKEEHCLE